MTNTNKYSYKSISIELIRFSIPLILSGILQQLYNWVDAFILGNIEGEKALGAIGGTGSVTGFFLMAITGFTIGTSVIAGQKYGEGNLHFIDRLLSIFTFILGGFMLIACLLGMFFAPSLLQLISTPPDILELANSYMRIILAGIPFLAVYNVYSAVLRGVGDSKAPFYSILVSSVINVILDIICVAVFRFGIRGAAAATIISQIMMTIFIIIYTRKKHPKIQFSLKKAPLDRAVIKVGFRFSIPPMIQSCVTAAGNLILQNFMNGFGTTTVIAITTSYRVDTIALLPITNLGSAISTFTAQCYGSKDIKRLDKIRKCGIGVMFVFSVIITALVIPFGSKIVALFGAEAAAVQIAADFFLRLALFYVIFGGIFSVRGYLEGIGDVTFSSISGIIMLAVRIVMSYVLVGAFGNMVIAYAEAIAWISGFVLVIIRMKYKRIVE